MSAVALKNIEIIDRLRLPQHVLSKQSGLGGVLRELLEFDVVIDVRGTGYFWAIELASRTLDGRKLTVAEKNHLYGDGILRRQLETSGVLLRVSTEGAYPVISVAPPLVADFEEFDVLGKALRRALELVDREHHRMSGGGSRVVPTR